MTPALFGVTVLALSGAPHCAGMCGAIACVAGPRASDQAPYHLGRLLTYAGLGAVAGSVGKVLMPSGASVTALSAVVLVVTALAIAGLLPEPRFQMPSVVRAMSRLTERKDVIGRLLLGALNGLLPCGLVYAALAAPVALGNPLAGAVIMAGFGVLTAPALVAATFGARRLLSALPGGRYALAGSVLVFGLGSMALRGGLFADEPASDGVPPCHQH
jgi:sulfite exporter TauE/SafE